MCDCLGSTSLSLSLSKIQQLPPLTKPKTLVTSFPNRSKLCNASSTNDKSFPSIRSGELASTENIPSVLGSENYGFSAELAFREKGNGEEDHFDFDSEENQISSSKFLELKDSLEDEKESGKSKRRLEKEKENLVRVEEENKLHGANNGRFGSKKGRQLMRRSSLLAKQVISIRTALTLGFVSQLWVDTTSWVVLFVEVRPNLLSGESERFLLEDVSQVGDVVLVEDETVIENEFKMIGLETLVGYKVVTPGRRNIGKVRGYTFNINSGVIESLELDSFGISIIPSSLVSTYALLIEDVLEVLSDAVVVHEAAASRIQRLTKGFLDSQNAGTSIDDIEEYSDFERPLRSERSTKSSVTRKFHRMNKEMEDDWELPMDYL